MTKEKESHKDYTKNNEIVMQMKINKFARFWSYIGFIFTLGIAKGPRKAVTEKAWVREASIELQYGLLLKKHRTISLRNISDVQINDTFIGNLFGWKAVDIQAGDDHIILKNVKNATLVKDTVYGLQNDL